MPADIYEEAARQCHAWLTVYEWIATQRDAEMSDVVARHSGDPQRQMEKARKIYRAWEPALQPIRDRMVDVRKMLPPGYLSIHDSPPKDIDNAS